jgi:alpha-galactosidase
VNGRFRFSLLIARILASVALLLPHNAVAGSPTARGQWSLQTVGYAPTPPMGWNSWNAFGTNVDEAKVLGAATVIVRTGLATSTLMTAGG